MRKKIQIFLCVVFAVLQLNAQDVCEMSSDSIYGVVNVSVCNMRKDGKFTSGMETQALLGMPIKILQFNGWYEIQTPDDYTGWVHRKVITPMSAEAMNQWNKASKVVVMSHYGFAYQSPNKESLPVSDIVGGNRLKYEGVQQGFYKVSYPDGRQAYISMEDAMLEDEWRKMLQQDALSILQTAYSLQGVPYLWAGTSSKGVDCSGYVRTVLFMHDIIIPRDAWQQALVGQRIDVKTGLSGLLPGDLLFFGTKASDERPEVVSHVAFYMGDAKFIHSMGDVHVGSLDPADALYDEMNTNRLLYGGRILPYVNQEKQINTTLQNVYYQQVDKP